MIATITGHFGNDIRLLDDRAARVHRAWVCHRYYPGPMKKIIAGIIEGIAIIIGDLLRKQKQKKTK